MAIIVGSAVASVLVIVVLALIAAVLMWSIWAWRRKTGNFNFEKSESKESNKPV